MLKLFALSSTFKRFTFFLLQLFYNLTKLFSNLYIAKFLDISAKLFYIRKRTQKFFL